MVRGPTNFGVCKQKQKIANRSREAILPLSAVLVVLGLCGKVLVAGRLQGWSL